MSDMCFEDFDYDREDDLHSQAAELVEEKLKSPNKTHTAICPKCHGDGACQSMEVVVTVMALAKSNNSSAPAVGSKL